MAFFTDLFRPNIAKLRENRDITGLTNALKHSDLETRWRAVLALNGLRPACWDDTVLDLLRDPKSPGILRRWLPPEPPSPDPTDPFAVIGLLWGTSVKHAQEIKPILRILTEPLIATLGSDDSKSRDFAAKLLGAGSDPKAVGPLIGLLRDPHNAVRISAAEALGAIGDETAIDALVDKLGNDLAKHRKGAGDHEYESVVKGLGGISRLKSVEALAAALAGTNLPEVQRLRGGTAGVEAQRIRGGLHQLAKAATGDPGARKRAADILRSYGERV